MINQETWMFKTTYEDLRGELISKGSIDSMLHLGTRVFKEISGDKVRSTSFVFIKETKLKKGKYFKLIDLKSSELKRKAVLEKTCDVFNFNQESIKSITEYNWAYWLTENLVKIVKNSKQLNSYAEPKKGITTGQDDRFLKLWSEVIFNDIEYNQNSEEKINSKWFPVNKGGGYHKWYGLLEYIIDWTGDGIEIKNFRDSRGKLRSRPQNLKYNFLKGITWTSVSSSGLTCRLSEKGMMMTDNGATIYNSPNDYLTLSLLNSKVGDTLLSVLTPGFKYDVGVLNKLPIHKDVYENKNNAVQKVSEECVEISKREWNSRETSWNFQQNELIRIQGQDFEEAYDGYCHYWQNKFFELHKNEEELNRQFIDIYGLQDELTPDVPLKDITILKEETTIKKGALVFRESEIMAQFISYVVGCMFGRYSLDKPGLILANQGETLETYLENLKASNSKFKTLEDLTFVPDDDNVIPVLDNEWFEDDIVNRFYAFLKATFGKPNFDKNLAFVEDAVGDIRKYFLKTFYTDHVKRYKKRPIYWLFSSPSGAFNALIYMHRYTPDTLNTMLNGYLKEYQEKLKAQDTQLDHVKNVGTDREKISAEKEQARISKVLIELQEYDRELFKIATERIAIDLDDGVLVNYNKFGNVIKEVAGLNDKKTKKKVREFDWIDTSTIQ